MLARVLLLRWVRAAGTFFWSPRLDIPAGTVPGAEGIPSEPAKTKNSENISMHFCSRRGSAAAVVGDLGARPFLLVPAAPSSWDLRVCKENQSRQ